MTDAAANTALIDRFYGAFARRDHATMASLYHPEAHFRDPAFGDLNGPEITAMWRMLCEGGADLRLTHAEVRATEDAGAARWEARYTFGQTGRPVINRISARFRFRDGLIVDHVDTFSFWQWSAQAMGPVGQALGWSPLLRSVVRRRALQRLRRYREAGGETPG